MPMGVYRSKYPCCGQSRFEPVKRGALDGKVWFGVYDNKEKMWRPGHKYRTRRDAVLSLLMNFRHERIPFEPDDKRKGLKWLRSLTSLDRAMCRATRRGSRKRGWSSKRPQAVLSDREVREVLG